jgi:hypothetical protein
MKKHVSIEPTELVRLREDPALVEDSTSGTPSRSATYRSTRPDAAAPRP